MTDEKTPLAPPSRWTPYAVLGLLALLAGWVLRLIYEVEPEAVVAMSPEQLAAALAEARTGLRVGDGLLLLGGSLLGWSPPLPGINGPGGPGSRSGGGSIGTGLGVGIVLATAAVAAGCAPRHVIAEESVEVDIQRGPPCIVVVNADGILVAKVEWSKRCEVDFPQLPAPTPES